MGLGEMGHSHLNYAMLRPVAADYESTGTRAYAWTWADLVRPGTQVCDNNGSNFLTFAQKSTFVL